MQQLCEKLIKPLSTTNMVKFDCKKAGLGQRCKEGCYAIQVDALAN